MRKFATIASERLNWIVERLVALLMLLLVLDVWLGVIDRYLFHWQLPWPEVLARYLMIWAALLAISAGIARREHIGLSILIDRLPKFLRRTCLFSVDILTFGLFAFLCWYGIDFANGGSSRQAMIFDMTLAMPFAAIPVSAAIAALQVLFVAFRDQGQVMTHTNDEVMQ
ncbi:TRAP transporter small permease [Kiloniella sp.]|uniref:TRAP transporter small permease n=1 Tax=Kiloniella sp. TaxID=1938587 RepID=UPI003B025A43